MNARRTLGGARWLEPASVDVPDDLAAAVGGHPLVAQTLVRRGIITPEAARAFLDPSNYTPASPYDLPDMDRAVERVQAALARREVICVWGDFDVDGQTATTLLVDLLRDLGAEPRYYIPHREREGHGISLASLKRVIDAGAQLILTCDTGIAAHEAVDFARRRGVDVVITDHHHLPDKLPDAVARVNPQRLPADHGLRHLPGVGVAYKLAEALCAAFGRAGDERRLLDLVALGIVVDVAVQQGDTRFLLQRGIAALRNTGRVGLQEVSALADLIPDQVSEEHIGFKIGPRLNALGRLDDANHAVELLTTRDRSRAHQLALILEGLNQRRQQDSAQVLRAAQAQLERDPSLLAHGALVLAHPEWPIGIIGLVASRLAELYHRPAILIATPEGGPGRGSARSVEGVDITAAIEAQADLLISFGGHTLAAGLTIAPEDIDRFRIKLGRTVDAMVGAAAVEPTLAISGEVTLDEVTLDLVDDLERLAPFGAGNPPLLLAARDLEVLTTRALGRGGDHRLVTVADPTGFSERVLWWQGGDQTLPDGRFDLAFVARASDFTGQRSVQIEWVDALPREEGGPAGARAALEVVDLRGAGDPLTLLRRLREQDPTLQVYAEAAAPEVDGRTRLELEPADSLALWTIPPGPLELADLLGHVRPGRVILIGVDPELDALATFAGRLAQLLKYAVERKDGRAEVARLAAACAAREATIRAGLAWLQARGIFDVEALDAESVAVARAEQPADADVIPFEARLKHLLEDTAAYRRHWLRAEKPLPEG